MGYVQESATASMPILGTGNWQPFYFTSGSLEYIGGKQESTKHGSLYNYSLTHKFPGIDDNHELPHQFAALDQHRWIICLVYSDGKMRTIGSVAQGLEFFWNEGNSSTTSGFSISWQMTDTKPAQNLGYITQFFVNTDQYLVQRFETNIDYTLNADKTFDAYGPEADKLEYKEGYLIKK
ncbi:hypothetical protein Oweho_3220 [Owenweeksia hongkongensis DSM 17368]|uniref:Uncharacterized protein n=2 Tax=Owenweeksia TaxID=267986 RepID=G8R3T4_OWEHD|nr:hypothetical protein Oweho_3220 [Owenweeksia hongkongensis DSM 17368]